MRTKISILLFVVILNACGQSASQETSYNESENRSKREHQNVINQSFQELINPNGATIETRFIVPNGFKRTESPSNSFEKYLRQLPLKPQGAMVKLYDGSVKENYDVYEAVVDMDIGKKNLQQCADAIMRLRAEYLYLQKRYDIIHFNFTNGFKVDYSEWMKGKRMVVKGNKTNWTQSANSSNTYEDFRRYMD